MIDEKPGKTINLGHVLAEVYSLSEVLHACISVNAIYKPYKHLNSFIIVLSLLFYGVKQKHTRYQVLLTISL